MLIWISALLACTNSGLGTEGTGDTGPDVVECPWEGTWVLSGVKCGTSFDHDSEFFGAYANATMEITTGDDGCAAEFTWSSATCEESEAWVLTPDFPEESTVQWTGGTLWTNQGITECAPTDCTFDLTSVNADDPDVPCAEGDRANEVKNTVTVDTDVEGQITIDGLLNDVDRVPSCGLSLRTTWVKQ